MIIDTRTVPAAGLDFRGELASACLELGDSTIACRSPVACDLRLQLAGNLLLVRGSLSCRVEYTCSRCLKEFTAPVESEEFSAEIEFTPPFEIIDLTESVRQDIILALKYKPICSAQCRGLCQQCGRDLNRESCACKPAVHDSPFSRLDSIELQ